MATDFTVASFNLHGGVDAWGRPFDAVGAATALHADILLLQETWTDEGSPGIAKEVAVATGAQVFEAIMARGRRARPHPRAPKTWGRWRSKFDGDHALYLESERPLESKLAASERYRNASQGALGIAILSKFPVLASSVIPLRPLRRDRVVRQILAVAVEIDGTEVIVLCAHMAHLTHGGTRHYRRLRRELKLLRDQGKPIIFGGDMNLWGPTVSLQLPHLHRAVKERTWPSWRPHSQLDHLFVNRRLVVLGGRAVDERGSDHRPILARLRLR